MVADIRAAAEAVGVTAIITNATEKLETQLNRITGIEQLPIMLISWDLLTQLTFDEHGFLDNPSTQVTLLLMDKVDIKTKDEMEERAGEMGELFQQFIFQLHSTLIKYQKKSSEEILSGIEYTLVPKHGAGQHSGILGKFTMKTKIANCT